MLELLEIVRLLLTGPLLLAAGAVAWLRHDRRQALRAQSRQWQQRFLEGR
jgi:cell division protein FtsL